MASTRTPPPGKKFTSENAREMQRRSAIKRSENARKFREAMQDELVKARGDLLTKKLLKEEDWRAWIAAVEQAFGKPKETTEHEHTGQVTFVLRSAFDDDDGGGGGAIQGVVEAEGVGSGVAGSGLLEASGVGGDSVR